ncbi:hypothetical protein [Actinoplanes derwentensis]|uniref:Uncharacterized protein n=1 Tax=Actinoplanes derwentensis TaxID=113562 RepID=A0A1H1Z2H1_9ACTN|nr:hypothetical protein [Actinoplanes derwentensis]GID81404.1 hypothetical protein Ade03nite_03280 [Actinoplanes derwentensis]SDT27995.1 hypothetical protein SAMN04489716_3112 [Actinoplanes derwentensis]
MSTESSQRLTIFGVSFAMPGWMLSSQVSHADRAAVEPDFDSDGLDEEFEEDVLYDHFPRP